MSGERMDHTPIGEPCERCGLHGSEHRVRHVYRGNGATCAQIVRHEAHGDPCRFPCGGQECGLRAAHEIHAQGVVCGLPRTRHRVRRRSPRERERRRRDHRDFFVGIDGEGESYGRLDRTTRSRPHRYRLLAAVSEDGTFRSHVERDAGLSTVECLDWLLALPSEARTFGYGFGYDVAMLLRDVDPQALYLLGHPDDQSRERDSRGNPRAVAWNGYRLSLVGGRLTVRKGKAKRVVWDVRKFFQGPFVDALEKWSVGTPAEWRRMRAMKKKRSHFADVGKKKIREYCFSECRHMAELVHKLDDAHAAQGLTLRAYHGAGSSGAAMLKAMGVREYIAPGPDRMRLPIASAFFGGRFENSVLGPVDGPVYSWDIASAYPAQLHGLPCLACGKWTKTRDEREARDATTALVRYSLGDPLARTDQEAALFASWGPLPFRERSGSILYPSRGSSGWVWREEFCAAKRHFPHVEFREAWIYRTKCQHRPFGKIPDYYRARLELGAEAAGLVLKLALNSCYGKLAQSVGRPAFQSWIWAGMVTSGCRAQILDLLGQHEDATNVLTIATDGVLTLEEIAPPAPPETGTGDVINGRRKPLGGWDSGKPLPSVFFAAPGLYFPPNPTKEQIERIRARGVGRREVFENAKRIAREWQRGRTSVGIRGVTRFHGLKTSVSVRTVEETDAAGRRTWRRVFERSPLYGRWSDLPLTIALEPGKKREEKARLFRPATGWEATGLTLRAVDDESTPYARALGERSATVEQLAHSYRADIAAEQPEILEEPESQERDS